MGEVRQRRHPGSEARRTPQARRRDATNSTRGGHALPRRRPSAERPRPGGPQGAGRAPDGVPVYAERGDGRDIRAAPARVSTVAGGAGAPRQTARSWACAAARPKEGTDRPQAGTRQMVLPRPRLLNAYKGLRHTLHSFSVTFAPSAAKTTHPLSVCSVYSVIEQPTPHGFLCVQWQKPPLTHKKQIAPAEESVGAIVTNTVRRH